MLPIEQKSNIVSIQAGMTPLIKAEKLNQNTQKWEEEEVEDTYLRPLKPVYDTTDIDKQINTTLHSGHQHKNRCSHHNHLQKLSLFASCFPIYHCTSL